MLHAVIVNNHPDIAKLILQHSKANHLKKQKDYFGRTPLQIAINNKHDELITLLGSNLKKIKELPEYGQKIPIIRQAKIIKKCKKFLGLTGGDPDTIDDKGICDGLQSEFGIYAARKIRKDFISILSMISSWDETLESLKNTNCVASLNDNYVNLYEVFEQLTNNIIIFQLYEKSSDQFQLDVAKDEKKFIEIYNLVKQNSMPNFDLFFTHLSPSWNEKEEKSVFDFDPSKSNLTAEQLAEYITILSKLPLELQIKISAPLHTTRLVFDEKIVFFNPNGDHEFAPFFDHEQLVQCIQRQVFRVLGYSDNLMPITFIIYQVTPPNLTSEISYNYFKDNQLPKTEADEQQFIKQSPNGLSPLHIAIFCNSVDSVKKIMQRNFTNIHKKNNTGKSPLDWAFANHRNTCLSIMAQYGSKDDRSYITQKIAQNDGLHTKTIQLCEKYQRLQENNTFANQPVFLEKAQATFFQGNSNSKMAELNINKRSEDVKQATLHSSW